MWQGKNPRPPAPNVPLRTSPPPSPSSLGPFSINVLNANNGFASPAIGTAPFTYQYANLWSRRSTWGGNAPPVFNDTVFIPAGTTVILDVSPPRLGLIVVQGNLVFDPNPEANIWLQVRIGQMIMCVDGYMPAFTHVCGWLHARIHTYA